MFIFYVDLKLANSLMTCCLLSIGESKLNPSISKEIPLVLQMTGFCTELPSGMFRSLVVVIIGIGIGIAKLSQRHLLQTVRSRFCTAGARWL